MTWKVIKTEADYHMALKRAMDIFDAEEGDDADELDLLLVLVKDYEDKNIHIPQLTPAELYRTKLIEQRKQVRPYSHMLSKTASGTVTIRPHRSKTSTGFNYKKNTITPLQRQSLKMKKK